MLKELQQTIFKCTLCKRLVYHREHIAKRKKPQYIGWEYWGRPVPSFGDRNARMLIIGLAPAAHGANRTGRMFTGDSSGNWLFDALHRYGFANQSESNHKGDGLVLNDVYITSAVRCVPPKNMPSRTELSKCRPYLINEIALLKSIRVVVALGKIAFDTYLSTCTDRSLKIPTPKPRFGHGVNVRLEENKTLIGCYHPSKLNTQTGRLTKEMFERIFISAKSELANNFS